MEAVQSDLCPELLSTAICVYQYELLCFLMPYAVCNTQVILMLSIYL